MRSASCTRQKGICLTVMAIPLFISVYLLIFLNLDFINSKQSNSADQVSGNVKYCQLTYLIRHVNRYYYVRYFKDFLQNRFYMFMVFFSLELPSIHAVHGADATSNR